MGVVHLALLVATATAANPAGRSGGSGFGTPSRAKARPATALGVEASGYLARAGGDINRAQSLYFAERANAAGSADPDALAGLVELKRNPGAMAKTMPAAHELLLRLTWDSVAAFMPVDAQPPSSEIDRKLRLIAGSVAPGRPGSRATAVLDVGCGDGVLLPYVPRGVEYLGIDVSGEMIERARNAHAASAGVAFEQAPFSAVAAREAAGAYSCVLFNGSLQFFADVPHTLAQAARLLRAGGCIVITHVHGASFVRQEHAGNPAVAVSPLPTALELEAAASVLGLRAEEHPASTKCAGEDFYLWTLRRDDAP